MILKLDVKIWVWNDIWAVNGVCVCVERCVSALPNSRSCVIVWYVSRSLGAMHTLAIKVNFLKAYCHTGSIPVQSELQMIQVFLLLVVQSSQSSSKFSLKYDASTTGTKWFGTQQYTWSNRQSHSTGAHVRCEGNAIALSDHQSGSKHRYIQVVHDHIQTLITLMIRHRHEQTTFSWWHTSPLECQQQSQNHK